MKSSRMVLRIAAAAVVTAMLALVNGTPGWAVPAGTAKDAPPTWTLVDVGQRQCAEPDDPRTLYYFVILEGTWSVPVVVSYTGLPAGTELYGVSVAQPGTGDGHVVRSLAAFRLHGAALGRYTPKLWATDGVAAQSVPVTLDIRSRC